MQDANLAATVMGTDLISFWRWDELLIFQKKLKQIILVKSY